MNYLEYSNIPSAILNVHKEHITDFFIYFNFNITLNVEYNIPINIATANIIWLGISFLVANINPLRNISFKNKLTYIIE